MTPLEEWFDSNYRKYKDNLLKAALRVVGDRQMAEDMVQETFVVMLTSYERLRNHPFL